MSIQELQDSARKEWYLEYQIHKNRPGLLGDISSLLGMLQINIITINGVDHNRRGMLLESDDEERISLLQNLLERVNNITVTKIRHPKLRDRLAIRHGRYIERDQDEKKIFRFVRNELGILVDFLAEIFKKEGHQLIGIRGMPRVGKTESIVASSVCANKRWSFVSSTLLRQTVRNQMAEDELSSDHVFILDGIVSTLRATEKHHSLIREILRLPATKVIEHPDIFVRETEYTIDDFDYIIELRNDADEEISYDIINSNYSSFDIS
ncbi:YmfK family protein [Caldalkalibacillus mannanilyticus]|uniref:YmfK family protein n=1 Tax=Caldalkalibacillus mannanilyticus TaxID=1418 RepID=UPI0004691A48|nr:YmfK family protein [Caldalkalibacillus mannanilyticus]